MIATSVIIALHGAGKNQYEIAAICGVTHQCIYARLKKHYAAVAASDALGEFRPGDVVYEVQTGAAWYVFGPSVTNGCIRVGSKIGTNHIDIAISRVSRTPPQGKSECRTIFSVDRGDDPNSPEHRERIAHAMNLMAEFDAWKALKIPVIGTQQPQTNSPEARVLTPGGNTLRGKHPSRRADAQPCPHCGSNNTWSKSRTKSGKMRRMCREEACGRSFLIG